MGLMTFKGGIYPTDGKEISKDKSIHELRPKGELVYPVLQHIGMPAEPVVNVGDSVLRGQKIAEATDFVSSPIFSSVSGIVKKIELRRGAHGDMVNSIIIESDGEMKEVSYQNVDNIENLSKEDLINRIREAGVVGMGGAGFPTHVKLSPEKPEEIDYIIANCAECEPYLTADYRRMMETPEMLVEGMKIVLRLFENAKGILGIEDNKPDAIAKIQELVKDEPRLEVCTLQTKYPQGGERQLIYAVTRRKINSSILPAEVGCIVNNVETLICIYNAVKFGKPVINRIFTVTGDAVKKPGNFNICIGVSYKEILEAAGGCVVPPEKMISGGPMMGDSMYGLDIPTTKISSALLCLTKDEVVASEVTACINCGRCVEACPEHIIPSRLAKMSEHGDVKGFKKWNGMECIECGCCTFICPAKHLLTQSIKTMKKQILAEKRGG